MDRFNHSTIQVHTVYCPFIKVSTGNIRMSEQSVDSLQNTDSELSQPSSSKHSNKLAAAADALILKKPKLCHQFSNYTCIKIVGKRYSIGCRSVKSIPLVKHARSFTNWPANISDGSIEECLLMCTMIQ